MGIPNYVAMENTFKKSWAIVVVLVITGLICNCSSSHRANGFHASKLKEEELKAKSDFDLKQANAIVDRNTKDRSKNFKRAEKRRAKINERLEEEQKAQSKAKAVRYNTSKPKVVPSFY